MESIDYEAIHEELFIMLENHMIKELRLTLAEMNEYDISEFLGELWEEDQTRMGMVYRLLPKEIAADVFANLEIEEQETIINSVTELFAFSFSVSTYRNYSNTRCKFC